MASDAGIQPSSLQAPGIFDSILGGIVAGVEVYRNEEEDKYNDAAYAAGGSGSNTQTLLILGLVAVGLYLIFES